ncbi:MAG: TetR family transcriptional regulator [Bacteroidota bacterium]|nr:TetR family transcriptional regulator [Bacteroidota bacterium]
MHRQPGMIMAKAKKKEEVPAEEKIKQAARKLFTERGFDAVKTRDIAAEAGINLALLNYYFRSKQKLFDVIMVENFEQFVQQLIPVMGDENLSLDEIIAKVSGNYIDMLRNNPDLPFFILNEMKNESSELLVIREKMKDVKSGFIKRVEKAMKEGKLTPLHMGHLMMNFMGLVIFPFVAKPVLMKVNGFSNKEFDALMDERKDLVPIWLKAIMKAK